MKILSKIYILGFLFISFFAANNAISSQLPRHLGNEKKFRSFIYNPNEVYRYLGHYTYQGFIEFESDETIATITMGDPSLWLFEHLGNRLFLKPVGEDNSQTNMTIITNKRIYHFELTAKEARSIDDKDLIFVAKFVYPDEKDKNILEFPKIIASDEPDMRDLSIYNFNYQYTGENTIAPLKVFDNGEFTYFQFTKKNAELPAIFSVDAAGYESLVNFRASGSYIVVEKVAPQFTLRNGTDIVCVYNTGLYKNGRIVDPYQKPGQPGLVAPNNFLSPTSASPVGASYGTGPTVSYPPSPPPAPPMQFSPPLPGGIARPPGT
ncbi:MAG TPA: TrbG/VirB9 family P-type conjugative transfer protein [Rickettsiales bacterium]|nr:TrbG/VirB9 family P-type conjugative transfer protein [Rickettsiales bacterium]